MSPDVERRLRYGLGERDATRARIVALLRELGVLQLLRMRAARAQRVTALPSAAS
jgi:hypothetical protein